MEAISFVTQEHWHLSSWDFETMKYFLEKNNFKEIRKVDFGIGSEEKLLVDTDDPGRKFISLYVEARK
jgi:hypothetical protein